MVQTYGVVRGVRQQKYTSRPNVFTGTRLIDIVMERAPPGMVSIDGCICRTWYRGQPLILNFLKLVVLLEEFGDRSIHPVRMFSRAPV